MEHLNHKPIPLQVLASYQQRIDLDERYVKQRHLMLDLKIVFKTVPVMFKSRGAA